MPHFQLNARNFSIDPPDLEITEWSQALTSLDAVITLMTDRDIFFEEQLSVVELFISLRSWLLAKPDSTFVYKSMNFEEDSILVFEVVNPNIWRVTSCWQKTSRPIELSAEQLQSAVFTFLTETEKLLESAMGIVLKSFSEYS